MKECLVKLLFVCLMAFSLIAGCGDSEKSTTDPNDHDVLDDTSIGSDGHGGDVVVTNDSVTVEDVVADAMADLLVSDVGADSADVSFSKDVLVDAAEVMADTSGPADGSGITSDVAVVDGSDLDVQDASADVATCLNGCDDGNLCTEDSCVEDVCQHSAIDGCCVTVDDCVNDDACQTVACVNNACTLTPLDCPYGCTEGVCDMCATDDHCVFSTGYELPPSSALLADWSFDSVSGTTVMDESGNGNDATFMVVSDPVFGTGVVGQAYHNNKTGQLRVAPVFSVPVATASLSLWMTFNSFTQDSEIVERLFGDNTNPQIFYESTDDTLYVYYELDEVQLTCTKEQFSQSYIPETWYHFVVTFDVATGVTAYINGVKICENATAGTVFNGGTTQAIIAGGFQRYLNGLVDEIKAYSIALSENQVRALFLYPNMVEPNQACTCSEEGVSVCPTYTGTCLANKKCGISTTSLNDCGAAGCSDGYCGCSVDADCDDSDACTLDSCLMGSCQHSVTDLCK